MQAITIPLLKNVWILGLLVYFQWVWQCIHKALLTKLSLAVCYACNVHCLKKLMRGLFLELLMLKQSSHYIQQQWQTVLCMEEVDEHLLVVVAKYC